MPINYVGDLSTDLDRVRFSIGDTVDRAGVKPDGSNFTDSELTGLIGIEGSWQRAVAAAFETLAGLYSNSVDITLGPMSEKMSQAAASYQKQAERWRADHGSASSRTAGTRHPTRKDGYSQDVRSDEP